MNIREEIRTNSEVTCHVTQRNDTEWNKIEIDADKLGSILQSEVLMT